MQRFAVRLDCSSPANLGYNPFSSLPTQSTRTDTNGLHPTFASKGAISTSSQPQSKQRLDSWKEIAAFFERDERTVRRWEIERGLPIHRVPGTTRGVVFAYADELEEWLRRPQSQPSELTGSEPRPDPSPVVVKAERVRAYGSVLPSTSRAGASSGAASRGKRGSAMAEVVADPLPRPVRAG